MLSKNRNAPPDSIIGSYQIIEVKSKDFQKKFEDITYQVVFDSSSFSAYIGCNRIGGGYSEHEWSIVFGASFSTKMYCEDKNVQETALLDGLKGECSRIEEDGILQLKNSSTLLKLKKLE